MADNDGIAEIEAVAPAEIATALLVDKTPLLETVPVRAKRLLSQG